MKAWPHQLRAVDQTLAAIQEGSRRICLCSPPGTGKTVIAGMLIKKFLDDEKRVVFYTNRRLLLDQSARNFAGFELEHGIRAAGHEDERWMPFQVSSLQTEMKRLAKPEQNRGWELHKADLVICDEAHLNAGPSVRDIFGRHIEQGAAIVGLTATPVDLGHVYDKLIVACSLEEGRKCGALVPIYVYGPDEPDLRSMGVKPKAYGDDFSEGEQKKAMMTPTIFGRVWEWWNRLNPHHKPTIGFAPGVAESLFFAEEFARKGVSSAHIDGADVWINGDRHYTSQVARDDILAAHKEGRIKIIFNRFVLREGIDMPWAEFGILATIFGSVSAYLQTISRLGRSAPGKKWATAIDHGGNWHVHGSPNAERHWELEYTSAMIAGLREEHLRKNPDKIPVRCPSCAMILATRVCPCGFEVKNNKWPRPVVQIDGTLKEMSEQLFRKRAIDTRANAEENWKSIYWRFFKSKKRPKCFREAFGFYQSLNNWLYPNPNWKYMPIEPIDQFRLVRDVPLHRLRGGPSG